MATWSYGSFSAALPVVYQRRFIPQVQRKCPTLRLLSDMGRLNQSITGDKMRWVPRFSGQVAGAANPDGGSLPTAVADSRDAASLAFGYYLAPIAVTDSARRLMSVSAGVPAEFNPFNMQVMQNTVEAMEVQLKTINQDIFAGAGTSNSMLGLASMLAATGTYAGLAQATYSQWAATVSGNSGVLRSLTIGLLKTFLRTVAVASAQGRPNIGICQPALFDALEALFTPYTLMPMAPVGGGVTPGTERAVMNPATINLPGGQIQASGFRVLHWQSANCYFVEDPDAIDTGATNPNNTIFFLNSDDIGLEYPAPSSLMDGNFQLPVQQITAAEQGMGPLSSLPVEVTQRGRTKTAFEWDAAVWIGLKAESRNAHGKLQDVQ